MSATHFGCGCLVNRDPDGDLVGVSPCPRHRWAVQPELEALHARVLELRTVELTPPVPEPTERRSPPEPPDPEVTYVLDDDFPLTPRRT